MVGRDADFWVLRSVGCPFHMGWQPIQREAVHDRRNDHRGDGANDRRQDSQRDRHAEQPRVHNQVHEHEPHRDRRKHGPVCSPPDWFRSHRSRAHQHDLRVNGANVRREGSQYDRHV